jgi:hypothetical protein
MAFSDQQAEEEWKKAQGQVRGKSEWGHVKGALIAFVLLFAGSFALLHFVWNKGADLGENLVIATFVSMVSGFRVAMSMLRNRRR